MSASDLAGRRIREARTRWKWTAKELADRCASAGAPHITAAVITNLETRRRRSREITVDELLVLAHVLEVPPLALFVPLDDAEVLEVVPGIELGALEAVAWVADDDAALGSVRAAMGPPRDTERVVRRRSGTSPLTLLRQLRVLARAIKNCDRRLSSETYRQRVLEVLGRDVYERNAITLYGFRFLELTDWLASLGFTPPELPEVHEAIRRAAPGIEGMREEDMRGMETDPPEIAEAKQILNEVADAEDVEDSEVSRDGPVP